MNIKTKQNFDEFLCGFFFFKYFFFIFAFVGVYFISYKNVVKETKATFCGFTYNISQDITISSIYRQHYGNRNNIAVNRDLLI